MCCDRCQGQNLLYGMRKGRRHAWATGSFAISQRTWRSFGKIALDPAIDRAALHTRILGDDGNRLAFCDLGNRRLKAAIKSGVVRLRKRSQKVSTIRPTERRIGRSGRVHPDTSGSGRACRRTSGNLLSTALALWKRVEKFDDGSADNDKEPEAERTAWR